MDDLFLLLSIISLAGLIIGLIKPQWVIRWGEEEKKNRKSVLKYFGLGVVAFFILFGVTTESDTNNITNQANDTKDKQVKEEKDLKAEDFSKDMRLNEGLILDDDEVEEVEEIEKKEVVKEVPREYKSALRSAETYANNMYMSKRSIYEQLTSEYGEGFPAEAAQYAIDNLVADWNYNALKTAETYAYSMDMSNAAIYEQLISEHGEKFTKEEAQYAIDNLK